MTDTISFEEFCKGFGFEVYPFNSFTAEDEQKKQPELFISTKLYSPLFEAYEAGRTMLLSGDRGTGKTAITYDFKRRSKDTWLICSIDDFSGLEKEYNEVELYNFVLKQLVNTFFQDIATFGKANRSLSEDERILLTYYYLHFAGDATRGLAQRAAKNIQLPKWKLLGLKIYNAIRNPLNLAANVGVSLLADVVAKATSASVPSAITSKVSEYFPEIAAGVEADLPRSEDTLEALRRFATLIGKVGYDRIVIIFDKVDEDPRLENAGEEIADFILPILNNNKFLLDDRFQVVMSLWVVPLNFIRDKVRTQKVHSPEVHWDYDDLTRAFNKRVEVFSSQAAINFDTAFEEDVASEKRREVLSLSNKNPRDLWHLMNAIFRAQYDLDASKTKISNDAVDRGMSSFVQNFNFYEYYPRKANARANSMDVYAFIKHLLKLDDVKFTRNKLNEKAGTGSSTQNYTVGMQNLGLISIEDSEQGQIKYRIRDPKVSYAILNKVEISKD